MRNKILIIASFTIGLVMLFSFSVQEGNDTYEFLPLLSQYELYQGTMADLNPSEGTELYELTSHLFVDYAPPLSINPKAFVDFQEEINTNIDDEFKSRLSGNAVYNYPDLKTNFPARNKF